MTGNLQMVHWNREGIGNDAAAMEKSAAFRFGPETAALARNYHKTIPGYEPTPLVSLPALAGHLGTGEIWVKDESLRFGLNAFKVLGASYAAARRIAMVLGCDISEMPFDRLTGPEIHRMLAMRGNITLVTATDGNHGLGVAWVARQMGCPCYVFLPKGSSPERLMRIREMGAHAEITAGNYEETVARAEEFCVEFGAELMQDTVVGSYDYMARWIMEGYTTMADEAFEQLYGEMPTHIFLQAGVGSMAGAVAGYFTAQAALQGVKKPVITIVEPEAADCLFRTAKAADGRRHRVYGEMNSIMAGLCCGDPCSIGLEVLKECADYSVSMPDEIAARGMRILGNPLPGDRRVISGESGAAGVGFLAEVLSNPEYTGYRNALGLDGNSRILLISTEGATDAANYRRIVWDGLYPNV